MKELTRYRYAATVSAVLALVACHKPLSLTPPAPKAAHKVADISAVGWQRATFNRWHQWRNWREISKLIQHGDVQVIDEGDRITVVLPTDKYFVFNTADLNVLHIQPLAQIAEFIRCLSTSQIYVAGFSDDVGSTTRNQTLSNRRAQTIAAYLWSHGVDDRHLRAEGYGQQFAIADNQLMHASAQNRRIEIQWTV